MPTNHPRERARRKTRSPGARENDSTYDQIVRVTLQRIRTGGFADVSMRQVASDLGMTATALYHHFEDKDDLLDRVAELIFEAIPRPAPDRHWTERLRELVLSQQRVLLDHPGLARFLVARRNVSNAAFLWVEQILEILQSGGLDDENIAHSLNQLSFHFNPIIFLDTPRRNPVELRFAAQQSREKILANRHRLPALASMLERLPSRPYEDEYAHALDAIIADLRARAEAHARPRAKSKTAKRTTRR